MDVSVIIPVFNVAPYIERCLKSVMSQIYTGSMECILIDDCSQDDSIVIAEQFVSGYKGPILFRFAHHQYNRGLSAARNTGIAEAKGNYLYFLDSDDYITADCICQMMALVQRYPDVEMVQAGITFSIDHQNEWLSLRNSELPDYVNGKENVKPLMLDRTRIPVTAWNRLIRKDFILHHHLFFQEGSLHEDELWTFQLARYLTSLAILKQDVYFYDYRENSIMSAHSEQRADSLIAIAQQMITEIDDTCRSQTIEHIRHFIHLFSFDIQEESKRREMLNSSLVLSDKCGFFKRIAIRSWVHLAQKDIRKHRLLYSILYHLA